ncbi:NAD(+) synthase [Flavobacterium columnare]|nr:NAD(+) synthase [Flavobacterium columnare]
MQKISTLNVEKVNEHIVNWLKEYAEKARVKGFVVGISGGIDSALTSTLCAQTGLTTLCVEIPIHQAESHVNRAYEHINQLKVRFPNVSDTRVDLTPVFETFKKEVPTSENEDKLHLALANTRSRLRMVSLYYLAGLNNLLVAGTGNKVEDFGVGFFTKYGDGGVDISPIADLLKSDVRALASYVKVPESILNAKPTDGLFGDDRSDEDQLGANYSELEWAMEQLERGKTNDDFEGREKEVFTIYLHLNTINQHKINPIPVCVIPQDLK